MKIVEPYPPALCPQCRARPAQADDPNRLCNVCRAWHVRYAWAQKGRPQEDPFLHQKQLELLLPQWGLKPTAPAARCLGDGQEYDARWTGYRTELILIPRLAWA